MAIEKEKRRRKREEKMRAEEEGEGGGGGRRHKLASVQRKEREGHQHLRKSKPSGPLGRKGAPRQEKHPVIPKKGVQRQGPEASPREALGS